MTVNCPYCWGLGTTVPIGTRCPHCDGSGRMDVDNLTTTPHTNPWPDVILNWELWVQQYGLLPTDSA